jgi:selenide,water dikinase
VYLLDGTALIATADFITPVCDDARRFGRVAAANSLSDVFAMGGEVLFALNLCCFPEDKVAQEELGAILQGAAEVLAEAGGALLGGHSVRDHELKFGLAAVGRADPDRLLLNAAARPGERLLLTKPLGTGVLINAFKLGKLDAAGLEPALRQMERLNREAARLALEHGVRAATDVTGFGLAGHALEVARASGVTLRVRLADLPVHEGFDRLVAKGVTTGSTRANRENCAGEIDLPAGLPAARAELLFDPQTSGGLLLSVPADRSRALLDALLASGHTAVEVGEVTAGPPRLVAV